MSPLQYINSIVTKERSKSCFLSLAEGFIGGTPSENKKWNYPLAELRLVYWRRAELRWRNLKWNDLLVEGSLNGTPSETKKRNYPIAELR